MLVIDFLVLVVVTLVERLEDVRDLDGVDGDKETEEVFCVLDVFTDELVSFLLLVEVVVERGVEEDALSSRAFFVTSL